MCIDSHDRVMKGLYYVIRNPKVICLLFDRDVQKAWDEDTCSCRCTPRVCLDGFYQDRQTCECKPVESTCSAVGVRSLDDSSAADDDDISHFPKYVVISGVVMIGIVTVMTLYGVMMRRRDRRALPRSFATVGSHGSLCGTLRSNLQAHTTAYTITINSQPGQNPDEVNLTEDKTRF